MPGQQWKNFWRTKDGRLILTRWRNDSVPDPRTGKTKYVRARKLPSHLHPPPFLFYQPTHATCQVVATGVVIDAAPTAKDEFLLRRVVHTPSQSPAL
jgi:hypothetical protein